MNEEDERRCREIRRRAERRVGQLLKETAERGERDTGQGGDRRSKSRPAILKVGDLGLSLDQSSNWQRVASLSEEEFEANVERRSLTAGQKAMARALATPEVRRGGDRRSEKFQVQNSNLDRVAS
jgi:hypothetical protein